jgi:hypothetical protein
MTEKKPPSVSEDEWKELAGMIRTHLLKIAKTLPTMDTHQRETFVQTCRDALQLETWAESFDKDIAILMARSEHESE